MVDDHNPYIFLFGALPKTSPVTPVDTAPSLTISDSVLWSQCGGQRATHMAQILAAAFPEAKPMLSAQQSVSSSIAYDQFAPMKLQGPTGTLCHFLK